MRNIRQFVQKYDVWLVALAALIVSIISTVYYFTHHDTLLYDDAISRIDIARRVIDFKQLGLQQLGGIWLPLPQLLIIPFVAFTGLWHNGLAGSFVSMISFVIAATYIYRIGKYLTKRMSGGVIATAILMLNPNVLYMQSTPMSELLLLATLLAGTFYFIRWFDKQNNLDLVKSAFCILLATMIRYEAWMVLIFCGAIILAQSIYHRNSRKNINGKFFLFGTLSAFGIALWLLWNLVIFKNILYWFNGPYSPQNQQQTLANQGLLPTKHNLVLSFTTMIRTLNLDLGPVVLFAGLAALIILLLSWANRRIKHNNLVMVAILVLIAPAVLDIVSLYSGSIYISTSMNNLEGVRYGLETIPLIAVLIALVLSKIKVVYLGLTVCTILAITYLFMSVTATLKSPVTNDASAIYSLQTTNAVSAFQKDYKGGNILGSTSGGTIGLIHSIGLPFKDYIQEGDSGLWRKALAKPQKYVSYVILSNGSTGYATPVGVYDNSYLPHRAAYNKYYDLIYDKNSYMIFALKSLHLPSVGLPITATKKSSTKVSVTTSVHPATPTTPSSQEVMVTVNQGDSESSIVGSQINNLNKNGLLTSSEYSTVETEMVNYIGDSNLIYPGQDINLNLTYLRQLINQAEGTSSTVPTATNKSSNIANVTVTSGDSESLMVRQEIHLLDPNHELTSAEEAFVEGTMVQDLGDNNLIYPGQNVTLNIYQLQSLISSSKQLSASQTAAWQVYGNNIAY
ncbi:MAG TPA: glycosyltransferase family 39 protein [Candidatus Saccharimonadales bacterium]|nr:glycosyltransferase family 39 protein [Candidatus Saccharimonadales bacterium]